MDYRVLMNLNVFLGMMTAYALARIFSKLFGEVDFAAIDTDRNKYPIGKCIYETSCSIMENVSFVMQVQAV